MTKLMKPSKTIRELNNQELIEAYTSVVSAKAVYACTDINPPHFSKNRLRQLRTELFHRLEANAVHVSCDPKVLVIGEVNDDQLHALKEALGTSRQLIEPMEIRDGGLLAHTLRMGEIMRKKAEEDCGDCLFSADFYKCPDRRRGYKCDSFKPAGMNYSSNT